MLEHPFYERWSAGALERSELASYAAEYRYAVIALADTSRRAASMSAPGHAASLRRHADEEASPGRAVGALRGRGGRSGS